jgi:ribosomal protein S6E (S10)
MNQYHKIHTIFKRDEQLNQLIVGEYSIPEFEYLKDNTWVFTEKIDGTNIRVIYENGQFIFKGKTDKALLQERTITALTNKFTPLLAAFKEIFPPREDGTQRRVCFYGEGYGAGIQKGGVYRKDQDFILFDVNIDFWWLKREAVEELGTKLGIDVVPIIGKGTLNDMIELCKAGFKSRWGDFICEGIVARPEVELRTRSGDRVITKLKYVDFHPVVKEKK